MFILLSTDVQYARWHIGLAIPVGMVHLLRSHARNFSVFLLETSLNTPIILSIAKFPVAIKGSIYCLCYVRLGRGQESGLAKIRVILILPGPPGQ